MGIESEGQRNPERVPRFINIRHLRMAFEVNIIAESSLTLSQRQMLVPQLPVRRYPGPFVTAASAVVIAALFTMGAQETGHNNSSSSRPGIHQLDKRPLGIRGPFGANRDLRSLGANGQNK